MRVTNSESLLINNIIYMYHDNYQDNHYSPMLNVEVRRCRLTDVESQSLTMLKMKHCPSALMQTSTFCIR